ncbi:MAG: hypothetical protein PVI26_10930 [Chitinispirillia bacterium]|jgi:hypothetical protein
MKTDKSNVFYLLNNTTFLIRSGDYPDAASELNQCLQKIESEFISKNLPDKILGKLTYSLQTIFLMQKNKDWVAIADIIEFELCDILKSISEYFK